MKTVTVETLTEALNQASSGYDVGTTLAQLIKAIYDALPAPPLAEDVQAAVDWFTKHGVACWASCEEDPRDCPNGGCIYAAQMAIIAALKQANATIAALREALVECSGALDAEAGACPENCMCKTCAALALPVPAGAERLIAEVEAGRALYEAVRHDWGSLEAVKAYQEATDAKP